MDSSHGHPAPFAPSASAPRPASFVPSRQAWAGIVCAAILLQPASAMAAGADGAPPQSESSPQQSEPEPSEPAQKSRATARLISPHAALVPGQTVTLAIVFQIDPEWHIYSNAANDTGTPPVIVESRLPDGFEIGPFLWPASKRYLGGGDLLDHVYEGTVVLPFTLRVPANAKLNSKAAISLDLEWLVCKNICLFGNGTVDLTLPIASEPPAPDATTAANATRISEALAALPKPLPKGSPIKVDLSDGILNVSAPGAVRVEFHPAADSASFDDLATKGRADGPSLSLALEDQAANSPAVRGVLAVWTADAAPAEYYFLEFNSPSPALDPAPERAPAPSQTKPTSTK